MVFFLLKITHDKNQIRKFDTIRFQFKKTYMISSTNSEEFLFWMKLFRFFYHHLFSQ